MKNRIIDAFLYLFVFMVIQFVVNYAVIFGWLLAEGKSFNEIGQGFADGTLQITAPMLIVSSAIYSIITLIIFLWKKWSVVSGNYLRTRPTGVLLWAAVAALGTVIPSEVFLELVPLPDVNSDILGEVMGSRWGYLCICIFAPLVEEVVFRGAILRALLQGMNSHWAAIAVSAFLFALVHLNPAQMPHAFCLGLLLGWMYYRTGSIIPGIMVHWVNNTLAYAVYNIFPNAEDIKIVDLFGGDYTRVALSVVFSLLIFIPAIYQLHVRMKREA
ncbi:MAG: CPBP family intramembrane metalloprotease [Prevotella sp.]|nr:CPBP family intramembrane metalloprotease [Prevotella sp.]